MLLYLVVNNNIVVNKQTLLSRVWGYEGYDGNIVEVYIKYLRDKIDNGCEPKYIKTVRGRGYVVK